MRTRREPQGDRSKKCRHVEALATGRQVVLEVGHVKIDR